MFEAAGSFVAVVIGLVLTGALHWDGLADVFDGAGGWEGSAPAGDAGSHLLGVLVFLPWWLFLGLQIMLISNIGSRRSWPIFLIFILMAVGSGAYMGALWAALPSADGDTQTSRLGRPSDGPVNPAWLCFYFIGFGRAG